jgi:hypothetical protein
MAGDYEVTILETHTQDGRVIDGDPSEEDLQESDAVFYSVSWGKEDYYRWVSGPFGDLEDLMSAINDTEDHYQSVAS